MIKKLIIFLFVLVSLFAVFVAFVAWRLSLPLKSDGDVIISIPKNSSASLIVKKLNKENLFEPSFLYVPIVKLYAVLTNEKAYSGTYRFTAQNRGYDIIRAIFSGKQLALIKVTYPEGISLRQFASISKRKLSVDSALFVRIANSDSIRKEFGIEAKSAEGYFYPATFHFFWKSSPDDIIRELLKNSNKHWEQKFAEKAKKKNLSRHEILTLASIVEAETPVASERKTIAGVYMNRLRKGMKLEADPTVQYAIGEKKKLSFADLDYNSPYNTYFYKGLPPGPINSPSLSSIEASLEPEKNEYIYFVAVGDGSGRHNFARSFSQHQKYRREYKLNRRSN